MCVSKTEYWARPGKGGGGVVLPHGSLIVVVEVLYVVVARAVVGVSDGVLVHGGVGLGRRVEGWRDAVARLAAVVAVSVVHCAVGVIICGGEGRGTVEHSGNQGQAQTKLPGSVSRFLVLRSYLIWGAFYGVISLFVDSFRG